MLYSSEATSKFSSTNTSSDSDSTAWRPVEARVRPVSSHFQFGSLIQLANGELKRVENLTRDDFVRSAKCSSEVMLEESVITGLDQQRNESVVITFAVGKDKAQVESCFLLKSCQMSLMNIFSGGGGGRPRTSIFHFEPWLEQCQSRALHVQVPVVVPPT